MKRSGIGSHTRTFQGATDDWLTPPDILNALGEFDLDPCTVASRPWDTAKDHYSLPDDGLCLPWRGRIWLNPPYGPRTGKWLDKLSQHGNGIALVFARTETKMFFQSVWGKADGLLFLKNRLYFYHPDGTKAKGNSGGPSVLIAYGKHNASVLRWCKLAGAFCVTKDRGEV